MAQERNVCAGHFGAVYDFYMARCLRPGGRLLGSTFLAQGGRRQRLLLRNDDFGSTGSARDLRGWLRDAGLTDVSVDRDDGLAVFSATRP